MLVSLVLGFLVASCVGQGSTDFFVNQWGPVTIDSSGFPFDARYGHSFDAVDGRGLIFGGVNGAGSLMSETWTVETGTMEFRTYPIAAPPARAYHATGLVDGIAYVLGGCGTVGISPGTCSGGLDDVWAFDMTANTWTQKFVAPNPKPQPRSGAAYGTWESNIVVHGGNTFGSSDVGVYLYNVVNNVFTVHATSASVKPDWDGSAHLAGAVDGDSFYVYGWKASSVDGELWKFDLLTKKWDTSALTLSSSGPGGLWNHVMEHVHGGLLICGGRESHLSTIRPECFFADLGVNQWFPRQNMPEGLVAGASAVDGGNVVLIGGLSAGGATNSARRYYIVPDITTVSPSTGGNCGSSTVIIHGNNIVDVGGSPVCRFGEKENAGTRVNDTIFQCTTPATEGGELGTVLVSVSLGGGLYSIPRPSSIFTYVEDVTSMAATTLFNIEEGIAGSSASLTIRAKTVCNTNRITGGDVFTVALTQGATSVPATVVDHADGTYTATFSGNVAQNYVVEVSLGGNPIGTGPYTTSIAPALPDPSVTSAIPRKTATIAGEQLVIDITAADTYGNTITSTSGFIVRAVRAGVDAVVVDGSVEFSGGKLLGIITLTKKGTYQVTVETPNAALTYYLNQTVNPGPVSAVHTVPTSPTITRGVGRVGKAQIIDIIPRDMYGNAIVQEGVNVELFYAQTDGAQVPGKVTFQDGKYTGSFTVTKVGQYAVSVLVNNAGAVGSPFAITVQPSGNMVPENSLSYGDGLVGGVAGKGLAFYIQVRDEYGNNATLGGMQWDIAISCTSSPTLEDRGNGIYLVQYTPKHLGHFGKETIEVTSQGRHLLGSPFEIKVGYGWAFGLIIVLTTIILAICAGILCTYGLHNVRRKLRYMRLSRNPEEIFPPYDGDPDYEEEWAVQIDYEEGDLPPFPAGGEADYQFDQVTKDEVDPSWMHPTEEQDVHEYLNTTVQDFNRL